MKIPLNKKVFQRIICHHLRMYTCETIGNNMSRVQAIGQLIYDLRAVCAPRAVRCTGLHCRGDET